MRKGILLLIMMVSIVLTSSCSGKKYEPKDGDFQVTLEVDEYKVVDLLSNYNQSPIFRTVLEKAQQRHLNEGEAFFDAFYKEWINLECDQPLRDFFFTRELQYRVEECCDSDVINILAEEIIQGMRSTMKIIDNRLFGAGFDDYQISPIENTFRIQIVMSQNIDQNRALRLISTPGKLGIFETYNNKDISPKIGELLNDSVNRSCRLELLSNGNAVVGLTAIKDTSSVNRLLCSETAKRFLPEDLRFLWGAPNSANPRSNNKLGLYALRITEPDYGSPISNSDIENAKSNVDKNGHPSISLQLNSDGCRKYSMITRQNIGKELIVAVDDIVYALFTVESEEKDGSISFSGNFNLEESKDLTQIIMWGNILLPYWIVDKGNYASISGND